MAGGMLAEEEKERLKVKCRISGPDADGILRVFDLYFDGNRPKLVLAWRRGTQEPAQYVDLDPAMLRQLGPSDSLTYTYDGEVAFPPGFSTR